MPPLRNSLVRFGSVLLCFVLGAGRSSGQSLSRPGPDAVRSPLDDHTDWLMFDQYGWRAMGKGWYDTAEREFTAAVRIAQRSAKSDPRLLARSYCSLAWALQNQGKSAQAEPLARWALETRRAKFGPNAEPVAKSLNQVATIDLSLNRFAAAEPLLRQVIAMDRGDSPTLGLEQAQSESLLGLSLVTQRRYAEAEAEFGRAVALRATALGAKSPEIGDDLNNLAWSQIEQGKLAEARVAMEKALKLLGQARGEADPSVARALDGLARIDTEQHDLGAAALKYQRLIAIYERVGATQQVRLQEGLKQYATLLDQMGRSDDAGKVRARLGILPAGGPDPKANANFSTPKYPKPPTQAPAQGPSRS